MRSPQSIAPPHTAGWRRESRHARHELLCSSLAVAIAFLLTTSTLDVGRVTGPFFGTHDFTDFYAGGRCFIHSDRPYDEATLLVRSKGELGQDPDRDESTLRVCGGFAYPRNSARFFALLSHPTSQRLD